MERARLKDDMDRIDDLVGRMALKAGESLGKAVHAIRTQDLELAREVREGDAEIDSLQVRIEDLAAETLATQQPVASDLRVLIAAAKVAADFERAADYAVHLAKAVRKFVGDPKSRQIERLVSMAGTGSEMMRLTAEAFRQRSPDLAREAAKLDDLVDHAHKETIRDVLQLMHDHPEAAEKATKILTTSGYLERLGDHMTNACESIVFMVTGCRVDLNE